MEQLNFKKPFESHNFREHFTAASSDLITNVGAFIQCQYT